MTRTQYYTATSIDGFIADPDNSLSWLFALRQSEQGKQEYPAFIAEVGALAMGSTTYEWILDHENLLETGAAWPYEQPTWVFSSRELPAVPGDLRFVRGDVAAVHAEMVEAAAGRNVWLVGGGDLVGQFADQGLLDDIMLGVGSVFLGGGAPLLPRRITPPRLRLVSVVPDGEDFVSLRYELIRPPTT
ncbi:MAG TPA: dihydrofolate reductase family protein [Microlunatus sp.]|jgi:dihydrofolate reductase|nr:dihydrofolate reductase family protein [Microlunatus sp.]